MQYLGGKSRISNRIKEVISNEVSRRQIADSEANFRTDFGAAERERERESNLSLVSLFCGTCSVEAKLAQTGLFNHIVCNDIQPYLISMLDGVKNGYELPDVVTEEQYQYVRQNKDEDPILTGFIGIACAFGGKWFGGYARNNSGRNYAKEGKKSLWKDMKYLLDAEFICKDYREVDIPKNAVVYCDPPYNNTTGYGEQFNTEEFWRYIRELSKTNLVFISEQTAPEDFICIWERPFTRTLDVNKSNQFVVTEKLFIHKSQYR